MVYVDDVFSSVDELLTKLNKRLSTIKFAKELEKEGCVPYLDVLIIRNQNRPEFDIYRKKTI